MIESNFMLKLIILSCSVWNNNNNRNSATRLSLDIVVNATRSDKVIIILD